MANRLEKSLQQGWELLATHENHLNQDDTVPESSCILDSKGQELAVSLGPESQKSFSEQVRASGPSTHPFRTDEDTSIPSPWVWNAQCDKLGTANGGPQDKSELFTGSV